MNESRIEETILSAVGARWTKVAMVVVKVADAMGRDLPTRNERYEMVSKYIGALVNDGRLAARGDMKNWRASEVRLAGAKPQGT
jgi:hypothetical protein